MKLPRTILLARSARASIAALAVAVLAIFGLATLVPAVTGALASSLLMGPGQSFLTGWRVGNLSVQRNRAERDIRSIFSRFHGEGPGVGARGNLSILAARRARAFL